jgi:hypothetical protein
VVVAMYLFRRTNVLIAAVVVVEVLSVRTMMEQLTSQRMTMMKNLLLKTCLWTENWDLNILLQRLVKEGEFKFDIIIIIIGMTALYGP